MRMIHFITHPEVVVDPGRPVPRWHLSDKGIARMRSFAASAAMQDLGAVWASEETKAIEAAGILAAAHGLPVAVHPGLNENDRSATGYLPAPKFEQLADRFFAEPVTSVQGWERAVDAQRRVRAAFVSIVDANADGDVAIVAHGGVGTLLLCHLSGLSISRRHDQPFQGHFWSYAVAERRMLSTWRPIAPQ
ncbi:histidine phosphatase family protein [Mesorhizobium xinjiangense]|uniref:histidine phosphatase family protein n=1 Tax=Mesorhizobium xinjiangense TaxID=2678685 RepID=UPI0012ECDFD1|nr:histidine phosphatase family protein [Mesorhizobium xinjiangense]